MLQYDNNHITDLIGVGIGPFNLSLAALLSPVQSLHGCFFDRSDTFSWHPGLLLPAAEIQVSHLQDLVTLVDPTNPYSFVAYLAKHKRLYRFIYSHFNQILRKEFDMYLNWVSRSLPDLYFQEEVQEIDFEKSFFVARTNKREVRSRHIVLGNGLTPYIPDTVKPYRGAQVFHSSDFMRHAGEYAGKRIVVLGGGQSGAEIVQHLLSDSGQLPSELTWVTKRAHFLPLDESSFINELYSPSYTRYFYHLPAAQRTDLLQEQTLASDGISSRLIEAIYQRLYVLEFLEKRQPFVNFLMRHKLTGMQKVNGSFEMIFSGTRSDHANVIDADIVIVATGYRWQFPHYLAPIAHRIEMRDERFDMREDYSLNWDGPEQNRIYAQNAARHTHGIADPNLCLMAWRSAVIINSIADANIYDIEHESTAIQWPAQSVNISTTERYATSA